MMMKILVDENQDYDSDIGCHNKYVGEKEKEKEKEKDWIFGNL